MRHRLTEPDSKNMKAYRSYPQGYSARAVTTRGQIIVAIESALDRLAVAELALMARQRIENSPTRGKEF